MQLATTSQTCHLTYCTNIHAGESAGDLLTSLETHVPAIRSSLARQSTWGNRAQDPLGLGLRISGQAIATLRTPEGTRALQSVLQSLNCYTFTFNGFPFGNFHGTRVKADVYRPDWRDSLRLRYTNDLADLLAAVLAPGCVGSISTVPGSFKSWITAPQDYRLIADHLLQHVAHLVGLREATGRQIALALEPEPGCLLETSSELIEFFKNYLFSDRAVRTLASLTGRALSDCERLIHTHIGICYDVCHAAVEFEDPQHSLSALTAAGIAIPKIQLSSAMRLTDVTPARAQLLHRFAEPVYLHQVVQRNHDGSLIRYTDLDEAMAELQSAAGNYGGREAQHPPEWRIHFHVPIFLDSLPQIASTQPFLRRVLELQRKQCYSNHLEVETYTWDVLPPSLRDRPIAEAIATELSWAASQLRTDLTTDSPANTR